MWPDASQSYHSCPHMERYPVNTNRARERLDISMLKTQSVSFAWSSSERGERKKREGDRESEGERDRDWEKASDQCAGWEGEIEERREQCQLREGWGGAAIHSGVWDWDVMCSLPVMKGRLARLFFPQSLVKSRLKEEPEETLSFPLLLLPVSLHENQVRLSHLRETSKWHVVYTRALQYEWLICTNPSTES